MLPTPSTSHVDTNRIYEPAEDSFLLLDTLSTKQESSFLSRRFRSVIGPACPPPIILEVGTGSGVVLAFLVAQAEQMFARHDLFTLGIDINEFACKATKETVFKARQEQGSPSQSGIQSDIVCADLTNCIRFGVIDVLIFNPPYVPTADVPSSDFSRGVSGQGETESSSFDQNAYRLAQSYSGGLDGMEVTNRLLQQLPGLLNKQRGVAYVLLCKQNNPEEVKRRIGTWGPGWVAQTVGRSGKQGGWERLEIIRIWRTTS
ncbi:S-adenosylmethionine-dependent methyltransferase [Bachmanniomyces sp. S44760]|nr:S-adenosylmethionine-dependent methyltransferase [Bachmanniomyces sp. S44760]